MATFLGNKDKLTPAQSSLSGALSGVVTRASCSPFDVVKIRFQLQHTPIIKRHGGIGFTKSVIRLVREEGIIALWKGHTASQLLSVVYGAVAFGVFEHATNGMWNLLPTHYQITTAKPIISFLCGGLSGCVASFFSMPLDTLRTRLVMQNHQTKVYHSTLDALMKTVSQEGMSGLFRGLLPNVLQVFPASAIQFGSYTSFICVHNRITTRQRLSTPESFVFGALSGLVSKTATLPFDFTKKRLQVQGFRNAASLQVPHYSGLVHCISSVYKEEGVLGFYRGALPSLLKAFVTTGMTFMTYNFFVGLILTRKRTEDIVY